MGEITRFGISIDSELLEGFDRLITRKGYSNRSEAIRDLIRDSMVDVEWAEGDRETVGTITIVYNHEVRELSDKLTDLQHGHFAAIVSALHVHLDAHNCLEVLVVKGKSAEIRAIADAVIGAKGVKHGKLTMTTTGKDLR